MIPWRFASNGDTMKDMDGDGLIRVGVVDNDPLALDMLVTAVGRMHGCVVLWRAMSGVEALQLVSRGLRGRGALPDVMVVDLSLGDLSGFQVCRRICERLGDNRIGMVGITAYSVDRFGQKAKESGMDALLGKEDVRTMMEQTIVGVAANARSSRGSSMPGPDDIAIPDASQIPPIPDSRPLSKRELETLRYYAQGLTTESITETMGVGVTTVYSYRNRALAKLHAGSIPEAIHMLTKRGAM